MESSTPPTNPAWNLITPSSIAALFAASGVRWWLSGGFALDHWLHKQVRQRTNADVSTLAIGLPPLLQSLPTGFSAWTHTPGESPQAVHLGTAPRDLSRVLVRDPDGNWVVAIHVEDGDSSRWLYRRDARLQVPWERAVVDIEGVPTGAPEIQLLWKALRPRPEDDVDKDAALPHLSAEATKWFERAILSIHPHSSWSIQLRSPLTPAKASWNRSR